MDIILLTTPIWKRSIVEDTFGIALQDFFRYAESDIVRWRKLIGVIVTRPEIIKGVVTGIKGSSIQDAAVIVSYADGTRQMRYPIDLFHNGTYFTSIHFPAGTVDLIKHELECCRIEAQRREQERQDQAAKIKQQLDQHRAQEAAMNRIK
jgi:ribosomal protein S6